MSEIEKPKLAIFLAFKSFRKYCIVCKISQASNDFIHVANGTENGVGGEGTGGNHIMRSTRMQKPVRKMGVFKNGHL